MSEIPRLKQWLVKYQNPDAVYRDITNVVKHYPGLTPQQETYTFLDGSNKELINLTGTIPITYKGSVYNIPISIWIIDTHPQNAPICYVKPTHDMSLSVSKFVDQNGKIYLPYLHDWVPNASDLPGLVQVMIVTFGDVPPVFAKSRSSNSSVTPGKFPYPPTGGFGMPPGNVQPGYPPSSYPKCPYPLNTNSAFSGGFLPYPTTGFPQGPPNVFGPTTPSIGGSGTIKDEHIKESLITALEEKLLRKMREQLLQGQAELQTLKRTHDELTQGELKIDNILSRMEKEEKDLRKHIALLKDKEEELTKAIEKVENQESIDVDEAVICTTPLYKQLLNIFAEEAALEDTIYYMGEALRQRVIDLDVFLRQVRMLSRKQFMLRALMQKCRTRAGLAI